ncbi:MAG: prepilin peptidase [Armatimonadetes bacterium]|nr:prepilin peptidase [Armatimonadota bacterium]
MPFWFWSVVVFIYGTVVGSFLNVCICRMPRDESVVNPPSHCPKCNTKLGIADLAPLVSFLLLGRKCRYCGEPIGWRYFLVELATGLMFVALFAKYRFSVDFFTFALLSASLIAVFFIDLDHWIIPDQLSVFGIGLGVVRDIVGLVMHEEGRSLLRIPIPFTQFELPMLWSIAGLLICGAIFYAIAVLGELAFKKEAMGGGDIKLAAAIGANLALPLALLSFFVAVFAGSVIGIGMKVAQRGQQKDSYLPFGPMMVIGVFVTLFFGAEIVAAYMSYLEHGGM